MSCGRGYYVSVWDRLESFLSIEQVFLSAVFVSDLMYVMIKCMTKHFKNAMKKDSSSNV